MKRTLNIVFFLLFSGVCYAQGIGISLQYGINQSAQWDKLVQTANWSRPFQANKMSFFRGNLGLQFSISLPSSAKTKFALLVGGSTTSASRTWVDSKEGVRILGFDLGGRVQYPISENSFPLQIEGDLMFRSLTATLFGKEEELEDVPMGWKPGYGVGTALRLTSPMKMGLTPYIEVKYSPYVYVRNLEAAVLQANNIVEKGDISSIFSCALGLRWTMTGK